MEMGLAQTRRPSLMSRNPSAHIAISLRSPSFAEPNRSARSICREKCPSLHPGVQLQIFHLLDFSFIALTLSAGSPSIKALSFIATDVKNGSCHSCSLRHVFISDRISRGCPLKVVHIHTVCQVFSVCHGGRFVLFGSGSIELALGSSGRVCGSAATPRFASSAAAVRRLSSQVS